MAIPIVEPTFVLQCGSNGQLTVFKLSDGDLSSATLSQIFTAQRDINGVLGVLQAMMTRNMT